MAPFFRLTELALPFVSRVYNVLITAHAFLMILSDYALGWHSHLLVPPRVALLPVCIANLASSLLPPSLLLPCVHAWCWVDRLPAVPCRFGIGWTSPS